MLNPGLAGTPGHLAARVLKAELSAQDGRVDEARRALIEVLARFPQHHKALQALAGLERQAGRTEAERDVLDQLRRVSPEPGVLVRLAELDADPDARPRMPPPKRRRAAPKTRPSAHPPEDHEADVSRAETIPSGPAVRPGMFVQTPGVTRPEPGGPDPFTNATMAELLASQGDVEGALAMYRSLIAHEPGRRSHRERFVELGGARGDLPDLPGPGEQNPAVLEQAFRDLIEGS